MAAVSAAALGVSAAGGSPAGAGVSLAGAAAAAGGFGGGASASAARLGTFGVVPSEGTAWESGGEIVVASGDMGAAPAFPIRNPSSESNAAAGRLVIGRSPRTTLLKPKPAPPASVRRHHLAFGVASCGCGR